ncbi:MAG: endonuclease [Flavobacteriaceae bacterium]|nr:endonuclease [Flavobacteriaceae bacterium]
MFKKILQISLFLSFLIVEAQAPANYYNSTQGKSGFELKTELHQIISENHFTQPYGAIWGFFEEHDVKPDGTVWDIFSDCDFNFGHPDDGGNQDNGFGGNIECEYFNREHSFPRSWFGGNIDPMYTDIIHIYPADKMVNSTRAAYVFANVNNPTFTSQNGSKLGPSVTPGLSATAFEMPDDLKGDLARTYFYMATRYEDQIANWVGNNPNGDLLLNGTSDQAYHDWAIDLLYEWHINDPVDQKEIDRNNAAFEFQGNRNPFVDNPDFICAIWDVDEEDCTFSNASFNLKDQINIYPNPATNSKVFIETKQPIDQIQLYSITGKLIQQITAKNQQTNFEINSIKPGIYLLKVTQNQNSSTHKIIVK